MHKGFTKTTLSLLGAALLSSSAFATGPDLDGIPDVWITNKTKNPAEIDTGSVTTGVTNIYRFTEAIRISDYLTIGNQGTADTAKWLFAERAVGSSTLITSPSSTIQINGTDPVGTVPDATTVRGSGEAIVAFGGGSEVLLDFQNVQRTPNLDGTGSSQPASPYDEALIDLFVTLDDDSTDTVAFDSFSVFTTNDMGLAPNDLVTDPTAPTSIFSPLACYNDFTGWYVFTASGTADFTVLANNANWATGPNTTLNDPGRGTPTPSNTVTGGFGDLDVTTATSTLTIETDQDPANHTTGGGSASTSPVALQFVTFQSMRRDYLADTVSFAPSAPNTLMLVRYTLEADSATQSAAGVDPSTAGYSTVAAQTPNVRLRVGEVSNKGNGVTSCEFPDMGLNSIINQRDIDVYHFMKEAGTYNTTLNTTPVVAGVTMDIIDSWYGSRTTGTSLSEGQRNYGVTMSKLEVYETTISADRNELGASTVLYNAGATTVSPSDGSGVHLSSDSLVAFSTADWRNLDIFATVRPAGSRTTTLNIAADTISQTVAQGDGAYLIQADTNPAAAALGNAEVGVVTNDKLVEISAWYSSPTGSAADNNLPGVPGSIIRVGYQSGQRGGNTVFDSGPADAGRRVHGRAGYFEFTASNRELNDVGQQMGRPYAAATTPQMVSIFFAPNIVPAADPELHFRPTLELYGFPTTVLSTQNNPAINGAGGSEGTINWHRVIVRSYDLPVPPGCTP